MPRQKLLILTLLIVANGSASSEQNPFKPDTAITATDSVYQLAPSVILAEGLLEGPTTFQSLLKLGGFGLGGLSPIDGEIIILEGEVYHASHQSGRLRRVTPDEQTPFAYIKSFQEDFRINLDDIPDYTALGRSLDRILPSRNLVYAIRIDGLFESLTLRSVPPQTKPYPSIGQVVLEQNIFQENNISGTVVAFRFPAYLSSLSGSGFHLHFVDDQRKLGGHVLDLKGKDLTARIDISYGVNLILPRDPTFLNTTFEKENSSVMERAVRP